MGIVLPEGVLNNANLQAAREIDKDNDNDKKEIREKQRELQLSNSGHLLLPCG